MTCNHLDILIIIINFTEMKNIDFETKFANLPELPGCYLFKDDKGEIVYIGKAKSLKKRVRSYFQKTHYDDPKTEKLVSVIDDVDVLVTNSEIDALILESNLIKEHRPHYNIDLKDDKRFPYIKITHEPFPRLLVVRRMSDDKAKYFGPYTNAGAMRKTLALVRRLFPIRSCSLDLPSKRKYRVCLDYFIGRCPGCCEEGKTTAESYNAMIDEVIMFLSGKSREIIDRLRVRMDRLSDEQNYETAAKIRDQLRAIESVIQKQRVVASDLTDRDILAVAAEANDACVALLQVREGILLGQESFNVATAGEDLSGIIRNFLPRYYKTATIYPDEILIPAQFEDMKLVEELLKQWSGRRIHLVVPQKGDKADLVEMALTNAKHNLDLYLAQKNASRKRVPHPIYSLSRDLYLKTLPRNIAAFDISNLGKDLAVGSIVYFLDCQPKKSEYRRMRIKTVEGQDDFSMMKEIVGRYLVHLAENQKEYPDLLLIDGGKGQLNAALDAMHELNITDLQVASLAKRFEEVYLPGRGEPLSIPKTSSSSRLLQRIRDEAHRFAVIYHRNLRSKKLEESELDVIIGVGKKRKLDLLAAFGSVEGIRNAPLEALEATPNIPVNVARTIYEHFNQRVVDESTE
jgi:excinuclease ABC subunit C